MARIEEVSAEQLAELFHHYQEALANDFESQDPEEPEPTWGQTSTRERKLMVAAARLTLLELTASSSQPAENRAYFAKPGEADWGC